MTDHSKLHAPKESKIPKHEDDTTRSGDAKNGMGEDNHSQHGKEESPEDFIIRGDEDKDEGA